MIHRGPRESFSAWLVTGPFGHLYGTLADIVLLWSRWGSSRVRASHAFRRRAITLRR